MILGGRVGEETTVTSDEHDTPVGEMTTTHPEHAASGSKQRTVVATAFMTHSGSDRSTPGRAARQGDGAHLTVGCWAT
jgi:hypothetical protein